MLLTRRKIMVKNKGFLALVIVCVLGMGMTTLAQDKLVIGLAVPNLQADFFNQVKDMVVAEAEARGNTEVLIVDAENDGAKQVSQVQDLLTKDIQALIYIPAGATAASVPVKLAREAEIPVVCVDRFPPDMPCDAYTASDSTPSVKELGEWVIEQTGGEATYAIIHGQIGTTPEVERHTGWHQAMEGHPDMKLVAEQAADWDQEKAFNIAQDMLQKNPDITLIFGECDTIAMGAARAAKLANLDHEVLTVGFDGDVAALRVLKNGGFDATMTQQVRAMGKWAFQAALDLLDGKEVPKENKMPATLTTPENVDQFIAEHP